MKQALIVDDDMAFSTLMSNHIKANGYDVEVAPRLDKARQWLARQTPDMLLLDIILEDGNGLDLLDSPLTDGIDTTVVMSAHPGIEEQISRFGDKVTEALPKPLDVDSFKQTFTRTALSGYSDTNRIEAIAKMVFPDNPYLLGSSDKIKQLHQDMMESAESNAPLHIVGPLGGGSNNIAYLVHALRFKEAKTFTSLNCATEKDLHTLVSLQKLSDYVQTLKEGTLLIKNFQTIAMSLYKSKVYHNMRTLFQRNQHLSEDRVKIVFTSDLADGDQSGHDSIQVKHYQKLTMPSLNKRTSDIPALVDFYIRRYNRANHENKHVVEHSIKHLTKREWSFDIEEFEACVCHFFQHSEGEKIDFSTIRDWHYPPDFLWPSINRQVGKSLAEVEKDLIMATMSHTQNKREAAKVLGVSLKTLYNKLNTYQNNN